jgi:hypothetical protein
MRREPYRAKCRCGLSGAACQRDYQFHTVAICEASRGHYSIRIDGQGVVRAGRDLSQESFGLLRVSPTSGSARADLAPVAVKITLRGSQVRFGDNLLPDGELAEPAAQVLSRLLSGRGYAVYADELDELASATEGVLLGPKGTLMSGQSRCLRVLSTNFNR